VPESTAPGATRWTPGAALRRAVEVARNEGGRSLVFRLLAETFYRRLLVFELELAGRPPAAKPPADLSFGWLEENRVIEYERLRPGRGGQALARLREGHSCFGTWFAGELVGARWLATGSPFVEYLDLSLPLAEGDVYHYDSFTSPKQRRRGLSTISQAKLAEVVERDGRRRIIRAVLPENRAAVRDAEKAGFRRQGSVGFVRLGPWRREFRHGPTRASRKHP
jgi:RimJ/RimL family protein N-acetyltransferase